MTTVALDPRHGWRLEDVMAEVDEAEADTCGAPTASGECSRPVTDGGRCHQHRDEGDILVRQWRSYTKYVCGLCDHQCFHKLENREAVEEHIRRHH